MMTRPTASKAGLAGDRGEREAGRRHDQAADGRRVLGQDGQHLRVLGVPQRRPLRRGRAGWASSCCHAVRQA